MAKISLIQSKIRTKNYDLILLTSDNRFVIGKKVTGGWDIKGECLKNLIGITDFKANTVLELKEILRNLYRLIK